MLTPLVADRRPWGPALAIVTVLLLCIASVLVLDWDFRWLTDPATRSAAVHRFGAFVGSMLSPDLSVGYLNQCMTWAHETVATALLGTVVGAVIGWILAILASRTLMLEHQHARQAGLWHRVLRFPLWVMMESARLALDVLRGVPDFVWAVMLVPVLGLNRVVGTVAIAVSVAGILGKVYSELWDSLPRARLEPLRSLGAGRISVLFYGVQPLTARPMLSFTLMRAECAIRNASVLGVVVGGGLGGALKDELSNLRMDRVGTLVLVTLAVTLLADLVSNAIRYQLRNDPNHPRVSSSVPRRQLILTWLGVLTAVLITAWSVWDHARPKSSAESSVYVAGAGADAEVSDFGRASAELGTAAFDYWWDTTVRAFASPDLSWSAVSHALDSAKVPVAVSILATVAAVAIAVGLSWFGSVAFQLESGRFSGERGGSLARRSLTALRRWTGFAVGKGLALVFRAIPEVLWCLLLIRLFSFGTMAGVVAIAVHSSGVLARVFTETVDNIPYRRLEQSYGGSRMRTFTAVAAPVSWRDWMTYSFFQFESNVRMGVVLGIVGLGGLGFEFSYAYGHYREAQASTLLITMILLTVVIDRISRALKLSRATAS